MEKGKACEEVYSRFIGKAMDYSELVYEKKKLILQVAMSAEINMLGHTLDRLTEKNRYTRDFTFNSLKMAIREVIACFPVYRTYVNYCQLLERDRHYIEQAVARARRRNPALSAVIFDFLEKILLFRIPEEFGEGEGEWLDFS
jgi:(1->4)-alpha-D-glucan 1-alpha-D-glucosylmutase